MTDDLAFTGRDIFNASREAEKLVDPGVTDSNDALAIVLNRLLRERIGRATALFGCLQQDGAATVWGPKDAEFPDTHRGRLVCVEEVKK